jgi:DNA-binding NarL/FixJ family response regulator
LELPGKARVVYDCDTGEAALAYCLDAQAKPSETAILMDVQLAGNLNGIQAAVAIRREFPRFPVVFYSIQDDDAFYRDFIRSGILSHFAYVRKSNYLLPQMILPLLRDAVSGRSFIDPEIETRVQEVRLKDEHDPMSLLEPNEQVVANLLAQGLTNEQIAARMGFRDKRTISRTNGQIYTAWGLDESTTDDKVARTRAAIIVNAGRLISWDPAGIPHVMDERGEWSLDGAMNEQAWLNWIALAISMFNTILSLWLGLTILFNAERRSWGLVLAASGLLASTAFFFSHSLIVGQGAPALIRDIDIWWHVVWFLVIAAPYLWYLLMLWYSGYFDDRQSSLHRRQRGWLWLSAAYTPSGWCAHICQPFQPLRDSTVVSLPLGTPMICGLSTLHPALYGSLIGLAPAPGAIWTSDG